MLRIGLHSALDHKRIYGAVLQIHARKDSHKNLPLLMTRFTLTEQSAKIMAT